MRNFVKTKELLVVRSVKFWGTAAVCRGVSRGNEFRLLLWQQGRILLYDIEVIITINEKYKSEIIIKVLNHLKVARTVFEILSQRRMSHTNNICNIMHIHKDITSIYVGRHFKNIFEMILTYKFLKSSS